MEQNYSTEPRKTKNGKTGLVVGLIAAVAIVSGGAGFGIATLASNVIEIGSSILDSAGDKENDDNKDKEDGGSTDNNDDGKDDGGSSDGKGDISSALDAITDSNNGETTQKIYPSDVTPTGVNGEYTVSELYEAVNDTVVLVKVYTESSFGSYDNYYDYYFGYDSEYNEPDEEDYYIYSGYGSGVIFTEDGYILTNEHVVRDAAKVEVIVNDYYDASKTHSYVAEVLGSDKASDVAVIKITRDEKFIPAKLGNSDTLKVGQDVCAIGNPGITADIMFDHTLTRGIISGLNRVCLSEGYSLSLIQTDTAINSGNSGGGLFDMYGNVIGVVNSKIIADTYEGLGFALTINEAKPIMEDLLTYGYVKSRPVLGIETIELNPQRAQSKGLKITKGLYVNSITKGAAVEKSGLKVGDVITKINGTNVETVSDVQTILSKFKVGDTVTATIARPVSGGKLESVEITIELSESSQ